MHKFTALIGMLFCAGVFGVGLSAQVCDKPVIVSSSGQDMLAGVSRLTLTAPEGCKLTYAFNGASPSTDIAEAVESPVVIYPTVNDYSIACCALAEGMEPSEAVTYSMYMNDETKWSNLDEFNHSSPVQGIIAGPMKITFSGKVAQGEGKGKYWMFVEQDNYRLMLEKDSPWSGSFVAGRRLDFIKAVKTNVYAFPSATALMPFPEANETVELSYRTLTGYDSANDGYLVCIEDAEYSEGKIADFVVYNKFVGIESALEDGKRYTIKGIQGNESINGEYKGCIYFLSAEETVTETEKHYTNVKDVIDDAQSGDKVAFDCPLTVIAVDASSTTLIVADAERHCILLDGDIDVLSAVNPGETYVGIKAEVGTSGRAALSGELPVPENDSMSVEPMSVESDALVANSGSYVSFSATVALADKADAEPTSTDALFTPLYTVAGVNVRHDAIDSSLGELYDKAVKNYKSDYEFKHTGIIVNTGEPEFWPMTIHDASDKNPTTSIGSIDIISSDNIVSVADGRVIAPAASRVYDISGREVKAVRPSAGIYIVKTPDGKSVRIMIK